MDHVVQPVRDPHGFVVRLDTDAVVVISDGDRVIAASGVDDDGADGLAAEGFMDAVDRDVDAAGGSFADRDDVGAARAFDVERAM